VGSFFDFPNANPPPAQLLGMGKGDNVPSLPDALSNPVDLHSISRCAAFAFTRTRILGAPVIQVNGIKPSR
jgi:hypothetical protein